MKWFALLMIWLMILAAQAHAAISADDWYKQALVSIDEQRYSEALLNLRQLQRAYPNYRKMAAVQTRIAVLHESADAGDSLPVFLKALALRDDERIEEALARLAVIAEADPAGSLTDDALYISAYLQVMDRYDFAAAREALATLERRFPESAYSDSAQYLDAIAMEQMGDTSGARRSLIDLRDRHTALSLPLNFRWPAGTALSRYWFDRADRRLAIVEQRITGASTLISRSKADDGKLRVAVSVNGADLQLILVPSPLTRRTEWLDGSLQGVLPPSIGIFDGHVEGVSDSWVRAVLRDNFISGVVSINGDHQELHPANLMGTLDYYQPRSRKPEGTGVTHSGLADSLQGYDALIAPPPPQAIDLQGRSAKVTSDVRAVPLSIVVDSQYDRYYAGGGLANALNNLNVADGVYREFGLALMLEEALLFESSSDPMALGAVTLETILRSFRAYRMQYSSIFEDSALSYLFTGNPKTDVTLGLAWIDTACRVDGYDVGVTTPSTFGDVLLTHELGHSLGAQHDSDTSCNDNTLSLMWPNISTQTQAQFTSCSKQSILGSRPKSCLENSVDLDLQADSTGNTVSFHLLNPDSALTIDARLNIETSAPDQLHWPVECSSMTPTSAVCIIESIGPRERKTLSLEVSESFQGSDAPVTAQAAPVGLLELQKSDNLATASHAHGTSTDHLTINSQENDVQTQNSSSEVPSAGAAKSAGALSLHASTGLLLLLCLSCCRRRWPSLQCEFVGMLNKLDGCSSFAKCLRIRASQ